MKTRIAKPGFLVALIGLLLSLTLAMPESTLAAEAELVSTELTCGGVQGEVAWSDALPGYQIYVRLINPEASFTYSAIVFVDDTNTTGSYEFDLLFGSENLDGWTLLVYIEDSLDLLVFSESTGPFSRECFFGDVAPGGTGNGSVEAVDSRSGDVADPVEPAESVDDPDNDGRVQVP